MKAQEKKLYKALLLLRLLDKKQRSLNDLKITLEREKNKPSVESFLWYSEHCYDLEITKAEYAIDWIKNRYNKTIQSCGL